MGTLGTFDGFTTARLGIYAAQHGLMVTGNNISNINTSGYTRQRLDQVSFKTGVYDMYRSMLDNHIGSGALVTSINQVRDPYLDIRYRNTASDVGYKDTMLDGLQQIAETLDEVGKGQDTNEKKGDGILYAQFQDMLKSLEQLSANPTSENDGLVRESASALVTLFHTYANSLETLHSNMEDSFTQDVASVNEILTNIRNLNESIRKCDIHGDNALEMRDERNRQIDELSQYMHIKVQYSMEDVGAGIQVEKLTISLGNANPDLNVDTDETVLIDGIYGSQISIRQEPTLNPDYDPNQPATGTNLEYLDENGDPCELADAAMVNSPNYDLDVSKLVDCRNRRPTDPNLRPPVRPDVIQLADNDLHGSLQAQRELLTEKGEFATQEDVDRDPSATTKRGIPYYQKSLDLLARKFADAYNALNQGTPVDENGDPFVGTTITKELPALEVAADGTISKVDQTTGEYEKTDWTLDPATGYCIDKNGMFTGLHDTGCIIYNRISANGTPDQILQGLKDSGWADDNGYPSSTEYDDLLAEQDPAVKEQKTKEILDACLQAHGVKPGDTVTVTKDVEVPKGGPLFSNRGDNDDPTNITAANISISQSWSTGDVKIVPTWTVLFGGSVSNTTQNDNVDHMISKIDEALVYDPKDLDPNAVGKKLFEGSFNDMYSNMNTVLGGEQRITKIELNTYYSSLIETDTSRDGVSGVDLNDEAMNMMQYQKAYSAACRMMTAIDEAIDRLINNTGVAGR